MAEAGNRALNLAGQQFGRLTALERTIRVPHGWKWLCLCKCGTKVEVLAATLRSGHKRSCGCLARDTSYKHGQKDTPLHKRWRQFRSRCNNPRDRRWKDYGGRGITYVPEWDDFTVFAEWANANGFRQELQIDRVDNDGPYAPWNCRWVTPMENMNNRRNSRKFVFFGEELSISEASRKFGVPDSTLSARLNEHGLTPEEAVTLPGRSHAVRRLRQSKGLAPPAPKMERDECGRFREKA